ncbi:unnamed protein product [Absidia cylindrospora]
MCYQRINAISRDLFQTTPYIQPQNNEFFFFFPLFHHEINLPNDNNLWVAAGDGQLERVKELVEGGAQVNER